MEFCTQRNSRHKIGMKRIAEIVIKTLDKWEK